MRSDFKVIYFYVYVPIGEGRYQRYTREDWVALPLKDKVYGIFTTDKDLGEIHIIEESSP